MNDVDSLVRAAVRIADPAARTVFLDTACADDAELRTQVATVLGDRLAGADAPGDAETLVDAPAATGIRFEGPGSVIGRYRLIERIGTGGMGEVYLAEQREPVVRKVAFKIIKLGMDTREVVARFQAERQALAMMDHPSIARVFDAGATDTGRPFFVMELVAGIPITRYCDEHQLDLGERLGLFIEVCSAIQHAHQKGVIHRDIKPSNVLVGRQGEKLLLKVIDFGIAKATENPLVGHTVITQHHQLVGTPAYMSPEQAGSGGLDIDTRSDIYSLGVLLYELLTGTLPFDPRTTPQGSFEELQRLIREQEPPRPSARVRTLAGPELAAFLERRRLEPRRLRRALAGDLDWIVVKALEKDRARRYETANAFAQDIKRFQRNEPVTAVAPSPGYRFRKFVGRNRTAVAVGATILGLLAAGITISTWLAIRATSAGHKAAREAAKSSQVARFLEEMLDAVRPARARGRDTAMLKEILDTTAARLARELRGQPDVGYQLWRTIGRTYEAIGAMTNAIAVQEEALALARRTFGPSHTNVAAVLLEYGLSLHLAGRFGAASNAFAEALAMARREAGEDDPLTAVAGTRLGSLQSDLGNYAEAEPLLTQGRRALRRALGDEDERTMNCDSHLATLYFRQGRVAEMEPLILDLLGRRRRTLGDDHPSTLNDLILLAILRQGQGRYDEAEAAHREMVETKRRILPTGHPFTLTSMDNLAVVYGLQGRHAEAEALCRQALSPYEQRFGRENRNTLAMRSNLAEYVRNQGRYDESEKLFRETIEVQARFMAADDPFRLETMNGLAIQYFMQRRLPEAESLSRAILDARRAGLAPNDPSLGDALSQLTLVLLLEKRFGDAEPLARECLSIRDRGLVDDWRRFTALSQWGDCLLGLGRTADAAAPLREGFEGLKARAARLPAIDQERLREAIERLIRLAEATGDADAKTRWQLELAEAGARSAARRAAHTEPAQGEDGRP